jgi:hypothetical protein
MSTSYQSWSREAASATALHLQLAEWRWNNIHQFREGSNTARRSWIRNGAAKEACWNARRLSGPNIELTVANHQRVGWRNPIGRQEMQHRIRRGLAGKGVIRRNNVREQRAEIMRVEQHVE